MKTRFVAILALLALPTLAACGGGPCDDLEDCCNALDGGACSVPDDADDDACQAALDAAAQIPDAPDECK